MIYLAVGRGPSPRSVSECKIRHKKSIPLQCNKMPMICQRFAKNAIEGHGFYAAIIVENRNPLLKAITDEFETASQVLTSDKP